MMPNELTVEEALHIAKNSKPEEEDSKVLEEFFSLLHKETSLTRDSVDKLLIPQPSSTRLAFDGFKYFSDSKSSLVHSLGKDKDEFFNSTLGSLIILIIDEPNDSFLSLPETTNDFYDSLMLSLVDNYQENGFQLTSKPRIHEILQEEIKAAQSSAPGNSSRLIAPLPYRESTPTRDTSNKGKYYRLNAGLFFGTSISIQPNNNEDDTFEENPRLAKRRRL